MLKIFPIILCGGSGTRLWPLSRDNFPKQFIEFFNGESLFLKTIKRVLESANATNLQMSDILLVSNKDYGHHIIRDLEKLSTSGNTGAPKFNLLFEPEKKNTAPAISSSIEFLRSHCGASDDDVIIVLPSDHLIQNTAEFANCIQKAAQISQAHSKISIFGIQPENPATGYGYIECAEEISQNCYNLRQFKEKPNLALAKTYVQNQNFLWNLGMFIGKISQFNAAFAKHLPNSIIASQNAVKNGKLIQNRTQTPKHAHATDDITEFFLDPESFSLHEDISIDYAILEKESHNLLVLKSYFDWNDVGSFDMIYKVSDKNTDNNAIIGNSFAIKSTNCLLSAAAGISLATIGIENCTIIAERDSILVCRNDLSNDVKLAHSLVGERGKIGFRTYRPWGYYEELSGGDRAGYKAKKLVVFAGHSISYQLHNRRDEFWIVISGTATITLAEGESVPTEHVLRKGQTIQIPKLSKHRLTNNTNEDVAIIEVQIGDYLGEDDIIRFDDKYGRC